jgi:glycosyltransferase involved in cell wall biosynthesis
MTVPIAAWAATASLTCAMPQAVIAIPAHNEAARLPDCLAALALQRLPGGSSDTTVLVLANNCSDATAVRARALAPGLPFPLLVLERCLPPALAHAGGARRTAMDAAAAIAGPATALLCTDADARPEPGWLAANLAALAAGADAVAGTIAFDAAEVTSLPPGLRRREALEGEVVPGFRTGG